MKEPCCNPKVREELMKSDPTLTHVYFDLSNIGRLDGKGSTKTGQKIEVGYNHTMKSGEVREKTRNTFITHNYCPFCGKKYK